MSRQLKQAMKESVGQSKTGKALLSLNSLDSQGPQLERLLQGYCRRPAWHTWDAGTDRTAMKIHQKLFK